MGIEGVRLPVDVDKIAADADIVVEAKPDSAAGVSGMLLRSGDAFGILYATHIKNEGFQRFSIAHELGHYFLEGHVDLVFPDGDGIHESRAGFVSPEAHEQEADSFAVGLLMPKQLFDPAIAKLDDGLDAIMSMRERCNTSLTATAIRYTQRARTSMAVVVSTGPIIDYCFMSESLEEIGGLQWLRKGEPLPQRSATQAFNSDQSKVASAARTEGSADLRDWFGGRRALDGFEEVIGLGGYGKTLTVLTTEVTDEDEDEDAELEESWTPRFKR